MKYRITLNDEDYFRFNTFYAHHSKTGKRSKWMLCMITPVIALVLVMILFLSGAAPDFIITEAVTLAILSVFWYFYMPKFQEKKMRNYIQRLKADGKLPYHAQSEIEFEDSAIMETCEQGQFRVHYKEIENIYSEEDYLYIFYNSVQAFIIPSRCLGGDKERVTEFIMKKKAEGTSPRP